MELLVGTDLVEASLEARVAEGPTHRPGTERDREASPFPSRAPISLERHLEAHGIDEGQLTQVEHQQWRDLRLEAPKRVLDVLAPGGVELAPEGQSRGVTAPAHVEREHAHAAISGSRQ